MTTDAENRSDDAKGRRRSPRAGRLAVFRAVAPFEAVTVLAWAAVLVGTSIEWTQYAVSVVLVLSVGTLPLTGRRSVRFGSVPSAFLYLAAVAVLRNSAGGFSSGVGVLSAVPVFYVSLYSSRRELIAVIGGVVVFYLAPILLIGAPGYPGSQYRAALLSVTVSAIIGLTTQALVGRGRAAARSARERESMLERVNDAVRGLSDSEDARIAVCEAARQVGEASVAVLYEPVGVEGVLRTTAMVGIDAPPIQVAAGRDTAVTGAFFERRTTLVTEDVRERVGSPELWMAAGSPESVLYEPLLRGEEAVGVLVVGWGTKVGPRESRASVVSLLAHEAAAVIERADLLGRLTVSAETDPLTGLPNRRAWEAGLEQAAREGRRLTVAILDLDHFKRYNDTFGHPAGDRLLRETAAAWRDQLRAGDLLARIGGEEFGLLLGDCDQAHSTDVVDRLRSVVGAGQTCSAGLAYRKPSEDPSEALARADAALYDAKRAGRDRLSIRA